jgi:hypothetical protein
MTPARLLLLTLIVALPACRQDRQPPPKPGPPRSPAVPWPLDDPASYCRASCPLKVRCRLGQVSGALFQEEVEKCHTHCVGWIRTHAEEAAALHPCYAETSCGPLRACLAEVARIVSDRHVPAKLKECTEMCVTLGTCQGDETDCRLRCKAGEVAAFRALVRCGAKRCPELHDCVQAALATPR